MKDIKKKLFSKFLYDLFTINVYYSYHKKRNKFIELKTFITYSETSAKLMKFLGGFITTSLFIIFINSFLVFSKFDIITWIFYYVSIFFVFISSKNLIYKLFKFREKNAEKNSKDIKYARILFNKFKKPFKDSSIKEIESYGLSKDFMLYSQDDYNEVLNLYITLPIHMLNIIDNSIGSRYNKILEKLLPYDYNIEEDKAILKDTSQYLPYMLLMQKYKIPIESIQLILDGIYKQFKITDAESYEEKRDIIQNIISYDQVQSTIVSVLESLEQDIEQCDNIKLANDKLEQFSEEQEINEKMNHVQSEVQEQVKILEKMFV